MRKKIRIFSIIFLVLIIGIFIYFYLPSIFSDSIYPLEYKDFIAKYSTQNNLNPNFTAAVIYSESHFNPQATSPVGARGLMQLMPQTASGIAKELGESFSPDKLYDPETNIRFGCHYLGGLEDKYYHDPNVPLIAYNGGVGLADRYAASPTINLNAETSYYVVKVNKNQEIYNQLYGEWWKATVNKPNNTNNQGGNFVAAKKPTLKDLILSLILGKS
jgi:soluble lytic murein transglycosylase